jgi:hypothetical protein
MPSLCLCGIRGFDLEGLRVNSLFPKGIPMSLQMFAACLTFVFSISAFSETQCIQVLSKKDAVPAGMNGPVQDLAIPFVVLQSPNLGFGSVINAYNYFQNVEFDGYTVLINGTSTYRDSEGTHNTEYRIPGDVMLKVISLDYNLMDEEGLQFESITAQLNIVDAKVLYMVEILCKDEGKKCGLDSYDATKVLKALYRAE